MKCCREKLLLMENHEETDHRISFQKERHWAQQTAKKSFQILCFSRVFLDFFFRCVDEQGYHLIYRENLEGKPTKSISMLARGNHSLLKKVL